MFGVAPRGRVRGEIVGGTRLRSGGEKLSGPNFSWTRREREHIPQVISELSGPRVLVMHWQPGVRCTREDAFDDEASRARFMINGVEAA